MKKKISFCLGLLAVLLISSCVTELGAFKYYNKHPDKLAEICASKYPVETKIVSGEPVIKINTVYQKGDSIPCPEVTNPKTGEKTTPKVKCPDTEKIYVNTTVRDTIFQENTAKLQVMEGKYANELKLHKEFQGKYNTSQENLKKAEKKAAGLQLALYIAFGAIAACVIVIFRK